MMSPITRIRTQVFGLDQAKFAALAGATQGTVSRWERGILEPSLTHLQKIRAEAEQRGLSLNDAWLFETGSAQPEVQA